MTPTPGHSIRWRLMVAAVVTLAVALFAAGWGLTVLFERHVERRVHAELEADIRQLMLGLTVDAYGATTMKTSPSDQRYAQTFSGKYWQLEIDNKVIKKSRSLWDEELDLPDDSIADGEIHKHRVDGPGMKALVVVERRFIVQRQAKRFDFCLAAAVDAREIYAAVGEFRSDLALALGLLGMLLLAAFMTAVQVGLKPLGRLRAALVSLRAGDERRLEGRFPDELSPLVDDLNKVLDERARMAQQAKLRAADLAHGLKTPLTAIEVVADELRRGGEETLGGELSEYVALAQRHVERELALAASTPSGEPARKVYLHSFVQKLVRSLKRLSADKNLQWNVAIDPGMTVKIDTDVLTEVLGNLLDNARKWARSSITISVRKTEGGLEIYVDDDGPGIAEPELDDVLQRGNRLDETVPGTGFGLAIVSDILAQAGGNITLQRSQQGGLGVKVGLPVAA